MTLKKEALLFAIDYIFFLCKASYIKGNDLRSNPLTTDILNLHGNHEDLIFKQQATS
ncbi:hypothetical protein [Pedobacter sp. UBA4863]|uniref:hypothetical protein n=1 Tax=Pedobacter sp. UBA4863 TaxID=1947060 RepID=UPI0025FC17B2|nr:hypothetical protein [Pedobacter sp. UBA4863]